MEVFRLKDEKEHFHDVVEVINRGVVFRGTNLWLLVFAIFIASLGLNVNSTAVIIGAMLVSPLMGPIMGLGMGMAINDLDLLRKSLFNYLFSAGISLVTSTIYFVLSPINEAHSEILARTSPNIYDVLIALFGGLAGILAMSSRQKGNVLPGVAIATALMPPLCTAGYGLATGNAGFFFGALYLFLINSVFIALATLVTARLLGFPLLNLPSKQAERNASRIAGVVVAVTLAPSIYFGYDVIQQDRFTRRANEFIEKAAVFPNDYLLKKSIDARSKSIVLTYGGSPIEDEQVRELQSKLPAYKLADAKLEVQQGFSYLQEDSRLNQLSVAVAEKEAQIQRLQQALDSLTSPEHLSGQVFRELRAQYPDITSFSLHKTLTHTDSLARKELIALIRSSSRINTQDRKMIIRWLQVRTQQEEMACIFEN